MPDGQFPPGGTQRTVLWTALGRQRVGKTALLNATAQYFRAQGVPLQVWNADQQNRSHSLSAFFPDAREAPTGGLEDGKRWIEERLVELVERRLPAVLDVGGGFTGFASLAEEVPIVGQLQDYGVDVVGLFVIGPEKADTDYLDQFAQSESFLPSATVIVLNNGLVTTGRSPSAAFERVVGSAVIQEALKRDAQILELPRLACMSEVTDRGITFADAIENRVRPGQRPLSLFDPVRVREWWTKRMPEFFAQFPPEWLPRRRSAGDPASRAGQEAV